MDYNTFEFTESASNDLDETLNYIKNTLCNDVAASDFYDKVLETINTICKFPFRMPVVQNEFLSREDIRKAVVKNFILYYCFQENKSKITVLRIAYGRRNMNALSLR